VRRMRAAGKAARAAADGRARLASWGGPPEQRSDHRDQDTSIAAAAGDPWAPGNPKCPIAITKSGTPNDAAKKKLGPLERER